MARIIAILNQKGGVGKTTTAINVAAYMAKQGVSVLLVDLDPQGNATSGLGIPKQELDATLYDVLVGAAELTSITREVRPKIFLAPSNAQLAAAEVELVNQPRREHRLQEALQNVAVDYVIIDCPPSLGLLSINALTAADYVLIPVQTEYYALEGLGQLMEVVQRVRSGLNPKLEILGVVATMYDKRTSLSEQVLQELTKHFGQKVFSVTVPRNVRLAEAPSYGKPIMEYDKWSKGAKAYKQLAKEILQRGN